MLFNAIKLALDAKSQDFSDFSDSLVPFTLDFQFLEFFILLSPY